MSTQIMMLRCKAKSSIKTSFSHFETVHVTEDRLCRRGRGPGYRSRGQDGLFPGIRQLFAVSVSHLINKEFGAVELVDAYAAKMNEGRKYNAYVCETIEQAREQAKQSQKR